VASYETLVVEDRDVIRVVAISRPEVHNSLNTEVVEELSRCIEDSAYHRTIRGLVLTGAGDRSFVAGADIAGMADMTPEQALEFAGKGHAMCEMLTTVPMPTIAAVGGFALGGGCELALACDFIYATEKAKFGQPEVKLGIIPGFGGTQRLARRVGLGRALELCMSGAAITADEALRIGLVNRIVPRDELLSAAVETARRIAEQGPLAVAKAKVVVHRGVEMPLEEACQLEQEAFAQLFRTTDQREGMAAFLAKRRPQFRGE
jgi:enoyl-CoA hydratase